MASKKKPVKKPSGAPKKSPAKKKTPGKPARTMRTMSFRFSPTEEKELERRRVRFKLRSYADVVRKALGFDPAPGRWGRKA